jgi:hypothetical protein
MFAGLLAEIRAYGEGLVIAEQIPAKLIPDAIKNTAVKIVHRLPAADDREAVGATMNLTDAQSRYLVTLPPGQAAVFTDGMDFPVLAAMPDGTARETAGSVVTASPASVVRPRSVTCGADCQARPCTLRDMRAAQRTLGALPGLVLWAELAVLAHLTGWSMPLPAASGDLASRLAALGVDARLAGCAVSHAVDAAVAARTAAFAGRVSPGLHVPRAAVARPGVPVVADPGRPADPEPPDPGGSPSSTVGRLGTGHGPGDSRRDVRAADRRRAAVVRPGSAGLWRCAVRCVRRQISQCRGRGSRRVRE